MTQSEHAYRLRDRRSAARMLGSSMMGRDDGGLAEAVLPNLHTLDVEVTALKRLLDRRDADGSLVPADPALIGMAIAAVRKELSGAKDLLARIPDDAVDPYRTMAATMAKAVADLDKVLDTAEHLIASNE